MVLPLSELFMTRFAPLFLSTILLISLVFAGVPTQAEEPLPNAQLIQKLVTVDDFKEALPQNAQELYLNDFVKLKEREGATVVVLDVRSKESFERRHLKGSVSAPLTDLTEKTLPGLVPDKDSEVVLVCDYSFMPVRMLSMTIQAYPVLKANGYSNIHRLNLWAQPNGGEMISTEEQEKRLEFEGTEVKKAQ